MAATTNLTSLTLPAYTTLFESEWGFDYVQATSWMQANWHTSFYWATVYLVIIFGGQRWMKQRPRYQLKQPLILWNVGLALFSIIGAYRMIPELLYMLNQENGSHNSVCTPLKDHNPVFAFWAFAFILSKAPELGDTVFIVLRKQPLIFLHWYHHVTVLIYSWLTHAEYAGPSRWYIVMNFAVHSFMYTYFGVRAAGYRLPKSINIFITSSQILQMVVGMTVNIHAWRAKGAGLPCDVTNLNIALALLMYTSYFVLFARFFINSYLGGGGRGSGGSSSKAKRGGPLGPALVKGSSSRNDKDSNANNILKGKSD